VGEEMTDGGLYIDSDWKAEAAKEKEKLAADEVLANADGADAEGQIPGSLFLDLVNTIAMQAMVSLGGFQGPGGEQLPPNHQAAKHYIDMLGSLKEKTEGNLSDDEKRVLDGVLNELRMNFVQMIGAGAPQVPPGTEMPGA